MDIKTFEQDMQTLETLVERMEKGEMTLDDTLHAFEQGMQLSEQCQKTLAAAEQQIEQLVNKHGQWISKPLDLKEGSDA